MRKSNGALTTSSEAELLSLRQNTKLSDLQNIADNINDISISIGFKSGVHKPSGLNYAVLASILERGTRDGKIPPRPYLRLSGEIVARKLNRRIRNKLLSLVNDPLPITKARTSREMLEIADYASEETKRIIKTRAVKVLDNSIETLRQKNGNRPWIDTGELIEKIEGFVGVR